MGVEFAMRSGTNSINYQDHIGLQTDFAPEIKATADVEALLVEGSEHVHMLYTFRNPFVRQRSLRDIYDMSRSRFHYCSDLLDIWCSLSHSKTWNVLQVCMCL